MSTAQTTDAFDRYQSTKFFPALDGLRCISILGVISFHAGLQNPSFFGYRGGFGVQFFFVISGFLITTLLLRERLAVGDISLKKFYLRRTLRIFPLYYTVLAIYCLATLGHDRHTPEGIQFFHRLPIFITYTSNWFIPDSKGHFALAWSLATEEQFYLFWPAIVCFLSRKPWVPLAWIIAIAAADLSVEVLINCNILHLSAIGKATATSISTPICLGCVLAYLLQWRGSFNALHRVVGRPFSALLTLVIAMTMIFFSPSAELYPNLSTAFVTLLAVVACGIVASCCITNGGILRPILTNKTIRHIGVISYGMYLMHQLCLKFVENILKHHVPRFDNPPGTFVIGTLVTILLASLSYRYYESIFLRLKERWAKRPDKPAHAIPVAGEPEPPIGALVS